LGIKVSENVSKGTIIYKKELKTTTIIMQYAATESEITLSQSPIETYRVKEKKDVYT
jgi:hypothetical protein